MPIEYHLYRAKFIRPQQASFLHDADTPTVLFVNALAARPSAEFRRDYTWRIANLRELDAPTSGYFAIGRNSPTSIPRIDPVTRDFVDTPDATSPYTFVVYDAAIGFLAIQKETELAPTTEELASKIERLLSQTDVILRNEVEVKIRIIPDPTDFIAKAESAYAIKKFTATFTGPNPIDADELFQKPLSVYLKTAKGSAGSTTIQGSSLSSEVVVAVARSTAATANKANARIQEAAGGPTVRIDFSGDPVKLTYEEQPSPTVVLEDARVAYRKVRHD